MSAADPVVPGPAAELAEAVPENPARALVPPVTSEVDGILSTLSARRGGEDLELVRRAHAYASKAHAGQRRLSGEPYITHPVAVATIIADLGLDTVSAAAALLHDAVEDTGVTLAQIEAEFGPAVAGIVDGVTKLDRLRFDSKEAQQAATMRKMLVAMASDWRVLVIKLADRLHNMRTLSVMPEWKQRRTAEETRDIYAPLAHRLGIQEVKWQLEDLAFETLHPKRFAEIAQMVATRAPCASELADVLAVVRSRLAEPGIEAEVTGRPKNLWSIYEKMVVRGKEFDEIHDLVAIRVSSRREGLLGGARHGARSLAPGAGPLQGLHQLAEVQSLPVPAHHCRRAAGQAAQDPDTHPRDAPPGRVRHRRPLGVQGGVQPPGRGPVARPGRRASRVPNGAPTRPTRSPGCSGSSTGARDPRSGRVPRDAKVDLEQDEVYVFTPEGPVVALPAGSTPSTSPTPSTPRSGTAASGPRSTAAFCRWTPGSIRPTRSRSSPRRRPRQARPATGCRSPPRRGRATRSGSGSPASAGRMPSKPAARSSPGRSGGTACLCRSCRLAHPVATSRCDELRRPRRAACRHRRRPRLGARRSCSGSIVTCAGARVEEQLPSTALQQRRTSRPPAVSSGSTSRGSTTSWCGCSLLHPGARGPRHRIRHPGTGRIGAPGGLRERHLARPTRRSGS